MPSHTVREKRQRRRERAAERGATAGRGTIRSRVAGVVERGASVVRGTANEAVAPGAYQQIFRYSQLAVGEAGGARNISDIWATFLDDMAVQGMPQETIARLESLGGKAVLNAKGFDKSITAALDAPTLKAVKESHRLAKAAVLGLGKTLTPDTVKEALAAFAKEAEFATPEGKRILAELRKVDPKVLAKIGSNQALSVVARRGEDPFWVRQFNKLFKRQNTATLPDGMVQMLKDTNKGVIPKIAKGTTQALAASGAAGAGLAGGFGRKAVGILGKGALGAGATGLFLGLEVNRLAGIAGRQGRADKLALQGFQQIGPSSSVDFLRNIVDQQEQVARRKTVLQQHEPELFSEVVRLLGDNQQAGTLTSTERRIGSDAQMGVQQRGRSADDVKFLLDQLFTQVSGVGRQ